MKWTKNSQAFRCRYDLFKYDNIETYEIVQDDIEVKKKFEHGRKQD